MKPPHPDRRILVINNPPQPLIYGSIGVSTRVMSMNRGIRRVLVFAGSVAIIGLILAVVTRHSRTAQRYLPRVHVPNVWIEYDWDYTNHPRKLAHNTFLLVKTSANRVDNRMPAHFGTSFKWYRTHATYADAPLQVLGEDVVDALSYYPKDVIDQETNLAAYKVRQVCSAEDWGWSPDMLTVQQNSPNFMLERYKSLPALAHAWFTDNSKDWYLLINDNTLFLPSTLSSAIAGHKASDVVYLGRSFGDDESSYASSGSGILLSHGAMKALFGENGELAAEAIPRSVKFAGNDAHGGDAVIAALLADRLGHSGFKKGLEYKFDAGTFQGAHITGTKVHFDRWCDPVGSFSRMRPAEFYTVDRWYQALTLENADYRPTTFDFYQEFIQPHVADVLEGWNARYGAEGERNRLVYLPDDPAGSSRDACIEQCAQSERCYQWSYNKLKGCRLILDGVVAGFVRQNRDTNDEAAMGYMVDRMLRRRRVIKCDPLDMHGEQEKSEGWVFNHTQEITGRLFPDPRIE